MIRPERPPRPPDCPRAPGTRPRRTGSAAVPTGRTWCPPPTPGTTEFHDFLFSEQRYRQAEEAGFDRVEIFGGSDGRPYDENAERLVLRAARES
ncbi:hypothetical protein OHB56_04460 [Streptomyces sp. NBC_01635]|uniref:hypothetical protein n=1 Tax=Streptomyces sp. NBC_01635 TaxID=2975904 RepID=UPI003864CC85|nr:hypothetical protein OHB56_04460 [Streptomyces sp. NBC_01635]